MRNVQLARQDERRARALGAPLALTQLSPGRSTGPDAGGPRTVTVRGSPRRGESGLEAERELDLALRVDGGVEHLVVEHARGPSSR